MKRKTLYNFNSVQLTFNQCVFDRIQYRTEHNLYTTRLNNSTDNSTDYSVLTTRLTNRPTTRLSVWQFNWTVFGGTFPVDRFPIMDLSPGPTPATLNRNCQCMWFYTYLCRFTHVYLRVCVCLRAMHFYSRDYFANFLQLKVLYF